MFERVEMRAAELTASRRFYATVLGALPLAPTRRDDGGHAVAWGDFALAQARAGLPPTRGLHIGFAASSRGAVDAFWEAGVRAGHRDAGPPGPRPQYRPDYYGAFLLAPDGNSAEAVDYEGVRRDGAVDHLWIRVADLAASRRWYGALAQRAGLGIGGEQPERFHVRPGHGAHGGSFALVAGGEPTRNAHLAVVAGAATVVGMHIDPGGNRVELVQPPPRARDAP
ncbi:MAG TPA: VOC family protein [Conexibacter sp.]|jgi:catechol 2,3-dioxygenase-like lactoylglutathione lyase family enzyme|nr:VOC family protein [Conexibacter sp.]